jgi:CSLREA domain-containing protein
MSLALFSRRACYILGFVVAITLLEFGLGLTLRVRAAPNAPTFTVNNTLDAVDANPGDGICATSGNVCTLRAAIMEANHTPGGGAIINVPGLTVGAYEIAIPPSGADDETMGDLNINANMTIVGKTTIAHPYVIIDASIAGDRAFLVQSGVTASISNVTIENGSASSNGGGIFNYGTLTLTNSTVTENGTTTFGGGIANNGTLTLVNSTVSGNLAGDDGGGIWGGGAVTLINSTVSNNTTNRNGGGIYAYGTVSLSASTVISNSTGYAYGGAGIYNDSHGVLTLNNSSIISNTAGASGPGGGILNAGALTLSNTTIRGNTANGGGGIRNFYGTANMTGSTLSGNTAGGGGGIWNEHGTLVVTNATLSGNSGGFGAGIENDDGTTMLTNVTINGNNGNGIYQNGSTFTETITLSNTIIANSTGTNCYLFATPPVSHGYNLSSDGSCSQYLNQSGDLNNTDPKLGSLASNGGATQTHALLLGSPAIDAIPFGANGCGTSITTDQRGFARPFPTGGHCDIGAYEAVINHIQDDDAAMQYNGWHSVSDASANGGAFRESNALNDKVTFKFAGKAVKWVTRKGPDMGKALVTLDGITQGTFDLYNATAQGFTKKIAHLANTKHTLVIEVLHQKNKRATDYNVAVDALVAGGTITQENGCAIQYDTWTCKANASANGGSYRFSSSASGVARLTFSGDSIEWVGETGPDFGKAQVIVDGVNEGTFDLYNASAQWQVVIHSFTNLGGGMHTLEIEPLHAKNPSASKYKVAVDELEGTIQASSGAP